MTDGPHPLRCQLSSGGPGKTGAMMRNASRMEEGFGRF
jgi:hypothetical protein